MKYLCLPSTFIEQCRACSPLRVNRIISQPYFLLGIGRLGLKLKLIVKIEMKFILTIQIHNHKQQ